MLLPPPARLLSPLRLALVALLLAGCSIVSSKITMDEVTVSAAPDANGNAALAVDVALATRAGVGEQLAKLTAAEWFRRRAQLLRDNPDGLAVLSWELIPGQSASRRVEREVLDGYVFASYASPGDHRARLAVEQPLTKILLQASGFIVEGGK